MSLKSLNKELERKWFTKLARDNQKIAKNSISAEESKDKKFSK